MISLQEDKKQISFFFFLNPFAFLATQIDLKINLKLELTLILLIKFFKLNFHKSQILSFNLKSLIIRNRSFDYLIIQIHTIVKEFLKKVSSSYYSF